MNRKRQQGAALVISLIVLILMSLMVVGSSLSSVIELKIGNNVQFGNEAFQNAETGVVATVFELNDKELAVDKIIFVPTEANIPITEAGRSVE